MPQITPFLMFDGQAGPAIEFYTSLFEQAEVTAINHYDNGKVQHATLQLAGREWRVIDNPGPQDFTFTPSFSLFVDCDSEEELDRLYAALSEGGSVLMPPDNYGFSRKFCWVSDRFGLSWQINLP